MNELPSDKDSDEGKDQNEDFFDWSKKYIRGKNTRTDAVAFWIFFLIWIVVVTIAIICYLKTVHHH